MFDYVAWYKVELARHLSGKTTEAELVSTVREAESHLSDATQSLVEAGLGPEAAARAAVLDFGPPEALVPRRGSTAVRVALCGVGLLAATFVGWHLIFVTLPDLRSFGIFLAVALGIVFLVGRSFPRPWVLAGASLAVSIGLAWVASDGSVFRPTDGRLVSDQQALADARGQAHIAAEYKQYADSVRRISRAAQNTEVPVGLRLVNMTVVDPRLKVWLGGYRVGGTTWAPLMAPRSDQDMSWWLASDAYLGYIYSPGDFLTQVGDVPAQARAWAEVGPDLEQRLLAASLRVSETATATANAVAAPRPVRWASIVVGRALWIGVGAALVGLAAAFGVRWKPGSRSQARFRSSLQRLAG